MNTNVQRNGSFVLKKNEPLYLEGQNANFTALLLKGRLDAYLTLGQANTETSGKEQSIKNLRIFSISGNLLLGSSDYYNIGKREFSVLASEDCSLYSYPVDSLEQFESLIFRQKDYPAYAASSISQLVHLSSLALEKAEHLASRLRSLCNNLPVYLYTLCLRFGIQLPPASCSMTEGKKEYNRLKEQGHILPDFPDFSFLEEDHKKTAASDEPFLEDDFHLMAEYHSHIVGLPMDVRKSFFGSDHFIAGFHCQQASQLLEEILERIRAQLEDALDCLERLYAKDGDCLFLEFVKTAGGLISNGYDASTILSYLEQVGKRISEACTLLKNEFKYSAEIEPSHLTDQVNRLKATSEGLFKKGSSQDGQLPVITKSEVGIPEELHYSFEKILEFSGLPGNRTEALRTSIDMLRLNQGAGEHEINGQSMQNAINAAFFELYEAVFKKVHASHEDHRLYDMFLKYGYLDERLLDVEDIAVLYNLAGLPSSSAQHSVFDMKSWMSKIYSKEKDPSKDELDLDYFDTFKEMKRRGEVSDKDWTPYINNVEKRLEHEIHKVFAVNQKLCHKGASDYMPFLYRGMLGGKLEKSMITPEKIAGSMNKILEIDFSAFHRELSYRNEEKGIEKEFIMKQVLPDFILIPTFGSRGMMWQEIDGRNRGTPGRFMLPAFTGENLESLLIRLVGNFRWELCRTMMGAFWNDVSESSLTSDYTDYIQFYSRNRDLTEDAKARLKTQIQKYRGKLRDIFTSDYELWINYEARGILRLNKVARNILYKHCPFAKAIRDQLENQPVFSEPAQLFKIMRTQQVKEQENRLNRARKAGIIPDPEQEDTLRFYKEM